MSRTHILAIDQGTTNTKALLLDERGAIVSRASRPVEIAFPEPGWVEQDGVHLWRTVEAAMEECLSQAPGATLAAVAITNQRESVLIWDRATGQPLGPCVVWQCRRTTPFCADLRARGLQPLIEATTGLTIDPLFSASKARWLLDHIADGHQRAAGGALCIGTIDSWLLWHLTGGVHACDVSNASRTQLFNLRTQAWDSGLLTAFGIPVAALPAVKPSSGIFGHTVPRGALPGGIPVASLIGDSHAALFGHAAFQPGAVKATYGTGSSLMTLIDSPVNTRSGLSTTVAWALPQKTWYALEGNITVTGGAVEWLGRLLERSDPARDVAALADSVADAGGVYLVPAFAGLGAPHWDDHARGLLCGLTRGTTAAHLARATVDAIAYQVHDVFDVMRAEARAPLSELLADGGASGNDRLMQFQADILECPVVRNRSSDLSACGAAWLAGLAVGVWTSFEEIARIPRSCDRFEPRMSEAERQRLLAGWRDAVSRTATSANASAPKGSALSVSDSRQGAVRI